MNICGKTIAGTLLALLGASSWASADTIAAFRGDFAEKTQAGNWRYLWNADGRIGDSSGYKLLEWNAKMKSYTAEGGAYPSSGPGGHLALGRYSGHPGRGAKVAPDLDRYLITAYTLASDANGSVWISEGSILRSGREGDTAEDTLELQVYVNDSVKHTQTIPASTTPIPFEIELGAVNKGETIYLAVGPNRRDLNDGFMIDYAISAFPPGVTPPVSQSSVRPAADKPIVKGLAGKPDATFLARHEANLRRASEGSVGLLFIGDSITGAWSNAGKGVWEKEFAKYSPANFGVAGDGTQHVLWRIAHGELDSIQPKAAVLLIGTNNSSSHSPEEIVAGVNAVVQQMREKLPQTKILVMGVFPRSESPNEPVRAKIKAVNAALAQLDDHRNVRFLDISQQLLEPNGTISNEIMPDYLHLSPKGYQIWADAIRPIVAGMMAGR